MQTQQLRIKKKIHRCYNWYKHAINIVLYCVRTCDFAWNFTHNFMPHVACVICNTINKTWNGYYLHIISHDRKKKNLYHVKPNINPNDNGMKRHISVSYRIHIFMLMAFVILLMPPSPDSIHPLQIKWMIFSIVCDYLFRQRWRRFFFFSILGTNIQ